MIEDIGKIENQQWSRQSEDAFPPLDVGRGLVVLAPWHKGKEPQDRISIPAARSEPGIMRARRRRLRYSRRICGYWDIKNLPTRA
jgi:hypothetical protein